MRIRRKLGQNEYPTVGTLDAQSVKWGNRKSDNGFILGRTVDNAGKHDSKLACPLCRQTSFFWPTLKIILVDRGYRGEIADQVKSDFMIELEVVPCHIFEFFYVLSSDSAVSLLEINSIIFKGEVKYFNTFNIP